MSELRYYGLAAECSNTPDEKALAMLVKAHILLCRNCDMKPMAKMWQRIAEERNWLDKQDSDDVQHILNSD